MEALGGRKACPTTPWVGIRGIERKRQRRHNMRQERRPNPMETLANKTWSEKRTESRNQSESHVNVEELWT